MALVGYNTRHVYERHVCWECAGTTEPALFPPSGSSLLSGRDGALSNNHITWNAGTEWEVDEGKEDVPREHTVGDRV